MRRLGDIIQKVNKGGEILSEEEFQFLQVAEMKRGLTERKCKIVRKMIQKEIKKRETQGGGKRRKRTKRKRRKSRQKTKRRRKSRKKTKRKER